MRVPLKLNAIEQEHLQELYDAAGVARDELPYSDKFEEVWAGFQDRTFKNAEREQVFGAILKYVRSSSNAATITPPSAVSDDQLKQLKATLSRHLIGGKILPYSDEFKAAHAEFGKAASIELSEQDFWRAILRLPEFRDRVVAALREAKFDAGTNFPSLVEFYPRQLSANVCPGAERWSAEVLNLWVSDDYDRRRIHAGAEIVKRALAG